MGDIESGSSHSRRSDIDGIGEGQRPRKRKRKNPENGVAYHMYTSGMSHTCSAIHF